jgi:hypothetical protein
MNPPELAVITFRRSVVPEKQEHKGAPGAAEYDMIKIFWVVEIFFNVYNSPLTVVLVSICGIVRKKTMRLRNMTCKMLAEILKLIFICDSMQLLAYQFMNVYLIDREKSGKRTYFILSSQASAINLRCLLPPECKYLESEEQPNFWNPHTLEKQRPQS